jgi:glycine dehydrogenase subunit 1
MGSYIPHTQDDVEAMLKTIGVPGVMDLYRDVPAACLYKDTLAMPAGASEMAVAERFAKLADQNRVFTTVFRGAGAYKHYIPVAVKRIVSKESLETAYTPYQAEISQGVLQSIFEYQTMMCEITAMDVSNASVYDGATAAAEALNMCRERGKSSVVVAATTHPQVIETIETYCWGYGLTMHIAPADADGRVDINALKKTVNEGGIAAVYIQTPNFYGLIEDVAKAADIAHAAKAMLVAGVNPTALGLVEAPGALGADIACGEGQPLGLPLGFGGPYLGFMTCKQSLMRRLPGRIVGETTDSAGRRAFVLTLQAREQHIRREKASSNICSNEALCALTASAYLAVLGKSGFQEVARLCHNKAAYAASRISAVPGYAMAYNGEFFHEFVTECPDAARTNAALARHGILGGLPLADGKRILWCATECNSKDDIDTLATILQEECI